MKIVDKRKFVRTMSILAILLFGLIIFSNRSYSNGEVGYREDYIYSGDTLWSIAKKEANNNKYFENKDIRDIVLELKNINDLNNSSLTIGSKIVIPEYK